MGASLDSNFALQAPGLAHLTAQMAALLAQTAEVRAEQAKNAPQASNFEQRGLQGATTGTSTPVTGTEVYQISEAQSGAKKFFQAVFTFDAGSGAGRYRTDGTAASPTIGHGIPSGGVVLTITGSDNIKNFSMCAESGQSLTFARNLFT